MLGVISVCCQLTVSVLQTETTLVSEQSTKATPTAVDKHSHKQVYTLLQQHSHTAAA